MNLKQEIVLNDVSGKRGQSKVFVTITDSRIEIGFEGYGTAADGGGARRLNRGSPVLVQINDGKPEVAILNDINSERPVIVELEKAHESCRK